jgi:hypothetical protein
MEEVIRMREDLEQLAIIEEIMFGALLVLLIEIIFILIMSRKLYNFNTEKTYIHKFNEQKNKKTANAASLSKVRQ